MILLSSATSSGLSWSKIPRTQNYELRLNGEVVGTLRHLKGWSCDFMGESQEGRWIFRRSGLLGAGTEILDIDSHPIGKFKSAWGGGGLLVFADGQRFHLQCKGLWQPVWTMFAEDNQPILRLHSRQKTVELPLARSVTSTCLSLLVLFTWYRILQAEEDAAAAAMIAS